jgi:hypothetical protein
MTKVSRPPRGPAPEARKWQFKSRFRRGAFGWRSQPAIQRIKEAVSEIKRAARRDPLLGGDGAVALIERLSPALEHVDGSSGAIGTAVNNALRDLVAIIAGAPADAATRDAWLDRLWEAHAADQIPYIEMLADDWGELCASKSTASAWADRLLGITRVALSQDREVRCFFHGTTACLSALFYAERYQDVLQVLATETFWPYRRWAAKALAATGRGVEAIELAESSRGPWASDGDVDRICEAILLSLGRIDDAYEHYGMSANRASTYLATFRAVAKKYPHKAPAQILNDLVDTTPGDEGKWFASAKEAGLYAEALDLARRTPCDPKTLTRAAVDFASERPEFALEAGMLALHWMVQGYGYEITGADVWAAYSSTLAAAEKAGAVEKARERIKNLVGVERPAGFVRSILGRQLGFEHP